MEPVAKEVTNTEQATTDTTKDVDNGQGADTQAAKETEGTKETTTVDVKVEAQKMADAMLAKKMANMPSKEALAKFKTWEDSQKTETEKQTQIQAENLKTEKERDSYKMENQVLKSSVDPDKADFVVFKVSKLEGEFEENLKTFLEENPEYVGKNEEATKAVETTGVKTKGAVTREDGVSAILKERHPELFE